MQELRGARPFGSAAQAANDTVPLVNTLDEAKAVVATENKTFDPRTPPGEVKIQARALLKRKHGVAINLIARLGEADYARKPSVKAVITKIAACAKAKGVAWGNDEAWISIKCFLGDVRGPVCCKRHTACKKKVYNGKCFACGVNPPADEIYDDYHFTITLQDWDYPDLTYDLTLATPGGTSLFGDVAPSIFAAKPKAQQEYETEKLAMLPYKVRLSVTWSASLAEPGVLGFQFWPIDVDGNAVKRSKTFQVNMGTAA